MTTVGNRVLDSVHFWSYVLLQVTGWQNGLKALKCSSAMKLTLESLYPKPIMSVMGFSFSLIILVYDPVAQATVSYARTQGLTLK